MGLEHHDRLDRVLHTEEFLGMKCGSLGYVRAEVPGGSLGGTVHNLVPDPETGQLQTEKKYCSPQCPTLIAEHRGEDV